jgi:hypothetical protein
MIKLANSKNNIHTKQRAKEYLTKSLREEQTETYPDRADDFKCWFTDNYDKIVKNVSKSIRFDLDIFHNTYLKLYEKQLYQGTINDYMSYFWHSYFTNVFQADRMDEKHRQNTFHLYTNDDEDANVNMSNVNDRLESDSINDRMDDEDLNSKITLLSNEIMNDIFEVFPLPQASLFRLYILLKPSISYKKLSEMTHITTSKIAETISQIRKYIINNDIYLQKRKNLSYKYKNGNKKQ